MTWIERDLPTIDVDVDGDVDGVDAARSTTSTVKTTAWRIVASKSLIVFGVAAGVGQDRYKQSATISATVQRSSARRRASRRRRRARSQDMTRTNVVRRSLAQPAVLQDRLEGGQASGGTVDDVQLVRRRTRRSLAGLRLARPSLELVMRSTERAAIATAARDAVYMRRALALAERGWGQTAPNPMVGAVVVAGGRGRRRRISRALRRRARRGDRAARGRRARARRDGLRARSSHARTHGKTPPCADALIARGYRARRRSRRAIRAASRAAASSELARGGHPASTSASSATPRSSSTRRSSTRTRASVRG